jgi:hypothetical protein
MPGANAPKILVVDDQLESRDWLMKLLASIGFSVRGAENGRGIAISSLEGLEPAADFDGCAYAGDGRARSDSKNKGRIRVGKETCDRGP